VASCHAITGDTGYIVRVRTADHTALNDFVLALLANGKDRLHVRALVVLEIIKDCV
jgi:DNA-binding Lrp family transcriptional regulator